MDDDLRTKFISAAKPDISGLEDIIQSLSVDDVQFFNRLGVPFLVSVIGPTSDRYCVS